MLHKKYATPAAQARVMARHNSPKGVRVRSRHACRGLRVFIYAACHCGGVLLIWAMRVRWCQVRVEEDEVEGHADDRLKAGHSCTVSELVVVCLWQRLVPLRLSTPSRPRSSCLSTTICPPGLTIIPTGCLIFHLRWILSHQWAQ